MPTVENSSIPGAKPGRKLREFKKKKKKTPPSRAPPGTGRLRVLDLRRIRRTPTRCARHSPGAARVWRGLDRVIELDQGARRALIPNWRTCGPPQPSLGGDRAGQARRGGAPQGRSPSSASWARGEGARRTEVAGRSESSRRLLLPLPNLPDPTAAPGPEDELVRDVGEAGLGGLAVGDSEPASRPATTSSWRDR